jgi:hypothetical protein
MGVTQKKKKKKKKKRKKIEKEKEKRVVTRYFVGITIFFSYF